MNIDTFTELEADSQKTTGTTTKRRRKSRADQKKEIEQVKAMLTSRRTGLEVQRILGLKDHQFKSYLADLLLSGFQMPELTHTALPATALPEALSNLLSAAPTDLIRCEARDGAVVLNIIR